MGMTEAELFKAMERGELLAKDVLPKVGAEFRRTAREGGAYESALKSLRVQKGKFITESQRSADTVFKSGFEEGLAELYKELSDQLGETGKAQQDLGNIYKNFFRMLTGVVKVATPVLSALIQVVSSSTDILMQSATGWKEIYNGLALVHPMLPKVATGVALVLSPITRMHTMLLGALATLQELVSWFSDDLVGATEKAMGKQFNLLTGETSAMVKVKVKQEDGSFEEKLFKAGDYLQNLSIDLDSKFKSVGEFRKVLDNNNISFDKVAENLSLSASELSQIISKQGITGDIREAVISSATQANNLQDQILSQGWENVDQFVKMVSKSTEHMKLWTEQLNKSSLGKLDLSDFTENGKAMTAAITTSILTLGLLAVAALKASATLATIGGGSIGDLLGGKKNKGIKTNKPKPKPENNPKPKNKPRYQPKVVTGKDLAKRSMIKYGAKALGGMVLTALEPKMMGDATYGKDQLQEMMDKGKGLGLKNSGNSILNQLNAPNIPMSPMLTQQALQQGMTSSSNKVIFEGLDIQINIPNSSPEAAIEAGNLFADTLTTRIEAYIPRGR